MLLNCTYIHSAVTPIFSQNIFDSQPSGSLLTVEQGAQTLWLGGVNGIFGLTGTELERFDSAALKVPQNRVFDIVEDETGQVWVASASEGIFIIDRTNQTVKNLTVEDGLSSNSCFSMAQSKSNQIYAACHNGITSIDMSSFKVSNILENISPDDLKQEFMYRIAVAPNGNIWFSQAENGLYRYSPKTDQVTHFSAEHFQLNGQLIYSIYFDLSENLWVGTENGVNKFNTVKQQFTFYPLKPNLNQVKTGNVRRLFEDTTGVIWVGADKLYVVNQQKQIIEPSQFLYPHLINNELQYIFDINETIAGELVILSTQVGISILPKMRAAISYENLGAEGLQNIMFSEIVDENNLLLSGLQNLFLYNHNTRALTLLMDNIGEVVSMTSLESQIIVTTRDKLLYSFNKHSFELNNKLLKDSKFLANSNAYISSIVMASPNKYYFMVDGSNNTGVFGGSFTNNIIKEKADIYPTVSLTRQNGEILVGSRRMGVFKLQNEEWTQLTDKDSSKELAIKMLYEDEQGNLWLCTSENGLLVLESGSDKYTSIDKSITANSSSISNIVQDTQGYYWVTTNKGLMRFDYPNQRSIRLAKEDGIVDTDFESNTALKLANNKILIVGDFKNYIIDTLKANKILNERIQRDTEALITNIMISERHSNPTPKKTIMPVSVKRNLASELTLNYDQYLFTVNFSSNNYLERDILAYDYRLVGLSNEWVRTAPTENTATYTTLPAGQYEFQVRMFDPKSSAEQPIAVLPIKVLPPYWQTWQAYTAYILLLSILLYTLYFYRTKQFRLINLRLENAVVQRTKELNKRNKYIANLLDQKQDLFANVSHEIRTPLSLIIGPLDILLSKIREPALIKQIGLINRNAKRLTHLVDQILDLAKLETIKDRPRKKYSIEQSLKIIIESFVPLAELRSQKISLDIKCNGVLELIDDSLEKIISNLISNAIKYTPEGGSIFVIAESASDNLVLTVSDTGFGISEEMQETIFDRFTRVDIRENIQGSGIGLALVKELVKANHGTIKVKSNTQQGTSFVVQLPLADSGGSEVYALTLPQHSFVVDQLIVESTSSSMEDDNASLQSILVVEDNPDMRSFLVDCLSEQYQCFTAKNGVEGIHLAAELVPDLIISDVMMPEMNGFELAESIRKEETTSHIPLVLLTARGDEDSRLSGWQLDIDDYIAKPFNVKELQLRVARLLSIRNILKKRYSKEAEHILKVGPSNEPSLGFNNQKDHQFYTRFIDMIEKNYIHESFSRAKAAEIMSLSERQLNRKLGGLIDYNFSEYLRKYRLEKARSALIEGKQITEISYSVGFSSPSYFSTCFKAEFGLAPKAFLESLS
jgi:signal transduction histidine kinase/ligand-binding sensor domain-containing protein/CheY-like chemotaxis protein/AraC-like DNA-binding protein